MNIPTSLPRKNKSLQSYLVRAFSALFVFIVLALSVFLFNVLQLVSLNDQARIIFEENRRVFQLETMFKQYHLGLKTYTISSSPLAEIRLTSLDQRIDETLFALQEQPPIGSPADFESLANQKAAIQALGAEIIAAVDEQDALDEDEQDWGKVAELILDVDARFQPLYSDLGRLRAAGQDELTSLTSRAELLSIVIMFLALLSIPAFLFLSIIVGVTIYTQIHLPLEQLARAAHDLQERRFDPEDLAGLARRQDEIGAMAREFLQMASAVEQRSEQLQQEAEEIRAKIR